MSVTIGPNEILLNSIRFPLLGKVRPSLVSKQPEKQVLGDYSLETNPVVSTWGQKTGKNGILLEEIDEANTDHRNRSYWSTGDDRYTSVLPPLATAITKPTVTTEAWVTPTGSTDTGAGWTSDANAYDGNTATYAYSDPGAGAWSEFLELSYGAARYIDSIRDWVNSPGSFTRDIDAWYDGAWNHVSSEADSGNQWRTTALASSKWVSRIRIRLYTAGNNQHRIHEAQINSVAFTITDYSGPSADFNGVSYRAFGNVLGKLHSGGTSYTYVTAFARSITALIAPINNTMLVYLGDADNYWYMNTSEAFTETNETAANLGILWDGKAFKLSATGDLEYTVTPNSATPTWTDADSGYSLSNFPSGTVNSLVLYRDATGAYIIYAGTKEGVWAYDFANLRWEKTELTMPNHATAGKGMVHWRTGLYVSSGLQVDRYVAADTAQIDSVGLTRDAGLPALRGGEIVQFIQGYDEFYALVDSTYEGTTSRSTVMAYNELGWRCLWEETADNKAMYSGIVTSIVKHQLIFASASGVYSISLTKNIISPKRVSGYIYAASSYRILPWFDANSPGVNKLALRLKVKSRGCSATETIIPKYRIDHANTDLATGWTSLTQIESDTITEYTFASGAGLAFKAYQLRFDHARGATTTTSPEIMWYSLEYLRSNPIVWGYQFSVDCETLHEGYLSPGQLLDNLKTITETATLVSVGWRNDAGGTETYKCRVWDIEGEVQTGVEKTGRYNVTIIVP